MLESLELLATQSGLHSTLFPDDKFWTLLKEFADDNFKFDENGSKLSKRVENIVGKGEIARYEKSKRRYLKRTFSKSCS